MPSISCILPTARPDYSIIGLPKLHILEAMFKRLNMQTFKDFELIIVDRLYPKRKKWIEQANPSFPVKYVPIHPNHRFWVDRNRWAVCASLNTGIIHAEGELLVRMDDCCDPDSHFLQYFWDGYRKGYFPCAMHVRYLEGKPARFDNKYKKKGYEAKYSKTNEIDDKLKILERLYGKGGLIRDTRFPPVEKAGGRLIAASQWYYGYSSVSLEAALKVNGYDEYFDADKSIEDMDMGNRLSMAGYEKMFLLDVNHWIIEHEHKPIPTSIIGKGKPIKCNYAISLMNLKKKRWRANSDKFTGKDLKFIRKESLRPPCSPHPNYYADNCNGELWHLWIENAPIFELREERLTA